ncbi:kinase-like domain-containing protein, partial [Dissophora ornata]
MHTSRWYNYDPLTEYSVNFLESDQIGLGDNSYQVIPKSKRRDQERILENKRRQGKLLLVSLLDNFCVLYDQSPERNRKLFFVICKTLSNMGIIDEEYLEEMSAVRSSYQRAFRSLVLSALTSIKQEQLILEGRRIMAPPSTPTGSQSSHQGKTAFEVGSEDNTQSISNSFSSTGIVPSAYLHTPSLTDSAFASSAAMMRTMSFGDMFDNDPTRYKHDFVEICKLGKGGFASVFKARNKLDGIEYAIKKIRLRGGAKMRYEKIFREIKFLARLDHKNVIRYYSSWLEHADYPVSRREMCDGGGGDFDSNGDFEDEYDDEDADEDEYTNTISMCEEMTKPESLRRKSSVDYFGSHKEQHTFNQDDLSMGIVFGDDEEQDDGITFEEMQGDISFEGTQGTGKLITRDLTLFIQMQLCQTTLQDYLTHSTPGSPMQQTCHKDLVDPAANQHIFRAIVEGVAYIHDQDMIHRDLKPSNIFLGLPPGLEHQRTQHLRQDQCSQDSAECILTKEQIQEELFVNIESMVPKIGDFGLVTDMDGGALTDGDGSQGDSSTFGPDPSIPASVPPLFHRHSSSGKGYDQKADIYSLGIIFFELYHPFSTLMERHAVLRTLRNGELPPDFVSRWPKEAAFVLWLMAEDPRMRPTAREIL